jgi:transposase-like protein
MEMIPCPACKKDMLLPDKPMDVQLMPGPFASTFTVINQRFKCPHCMQEFIKHLQNIPAEALAMFQLGITAVAPANGIFTPPAAGKIIA